MGRRAQLLLIGGLGIAMTFVVLALVLNTVIFTQNLATREAVDGRSPIEFTNAAEQGVGGAITEVNYWNTTDYGTLDSALREAVSTWAGNASRLSVTRGAVADVELRSTTNGTRILQSTNRTWTNDTDAASWEMATSVDATRRFHANISRSSLDQADVTSLPSSSAFRINVTGASGDTWSMYVYRDTAAPDTVNVTTIAPGTSTSTCSVVDDHADLDVTEATLDGASCGFTFAENVSAPYEIRVEQGANASARYTLVVDTLQSPLLTNTGSSYNSSTTTTGPYTVPAIYNATFAVSHERSDIAYNRTITIAPEEVPVGERYNVST